MQAEKCLKGLKQLKDVLDTAPEEASQGMKTVKLHSGHWAWPKIKHLNYPVREPMRVFDCAYKIILYVFRSQSVIYVLHEFVVSHTQLPGLDKPFIYGVLIPISFLLYEVIIRDVALIEGFASQAKAAGEPEKLRFLENEVVHGVLSLFLDAVTLQLKQSIEILVSLTFASFDRMETHFLFKIIRVLIFSDSIQRIFFFAEKHDRAVFVA